MKKVGGNVTAKIQRRTSARNEIGELSPSYETVAELRGWLDYSGGEAGYQTWGTKAEETTHVFVCDYAPLDVEADEARLVCLGKSYDVLQIDDPMNLGYQLEISLKYTGVLDG